jgi:site-specific DNA recombinase
MVGCWHSMARERELTHDADRQAEAARLAAHAEAFCQRVRQGLEQADFGRKRELLELLIDRVIVTGDAVEIRYAVPVESEGEREPFCRLRTDYQDCLSGPWHR